MMLRLRPGQKGPEQKESQCGHVDYGMHAYDAMLVGWMDGRRACT